MRLFQKVLHCDKLHVSIILAYTVLYSEAIIRQTFENVTLTKRLSSNKQC